MSKEIWHRKLASIQFYIVTYRSLCSFLVISFILNVVLGVLIYYKYFHQGERDFYATNGIVSPIKITARGEANLSSQALLSSPKVTPQADKPIPE